LVVVLSSATACALETFDLEVAGKLGYATNPATAQGVFDSPNRLGLGLGGRVGLAFKAGPYLGASVVAYPVGSVPEGPFNGGGPTHQASMVLCGGEMGYGIKPIDHLTIRPQLGFGDAIPSNNAPVGITFWYLQPAVAGLVDVGMLIVGADLGMLLFANNNYQQAAFTFDAQVGVKF
jgi:hypothetical protein